MKILILAENPQKISQILRQHSNIKVIDEVEISDATPFTGGLTQPGYSEYITNRAANLSKIFNSSKTLCLVINQGHSKAIEKIPHDQSIRIYHNSTPRRLINSFTQIVDKSYHENEFTIEKLFDPLAQQDRATAF